MSLVPINLGVPTGTTMWYAGEQAPIGWLVCDGSTFSSLEYPVLASYLEDTFGPVSGTDYVLPDLVGKFIRGYGQETGRPFGSTQEDMFSAHEHGVKPIQHNHTVTDPTHFHNTTGVTHVHTTSGEHEHGATPGTHIHGETFPSAGYLFAALDPGAVETYYVGYKYCAESHISGFFCPLGVANVKRVYDVAFTGVTINTAFTGITTTGISLTGVTFLTAKTDISVDFAQTGITVDDFGALNTRPVNIALLPIIRT